LAKKSISAIVEADGTCELKCGFCGDTVTIHIKDWDADYFRDKITNSGKLKAAINPFVQLHEGCMNRKLN
jgi:hypothetical protein